MTARSYWAAAAAAAVTSFLAALTFLPAAAEAEEDEEKKRSMPKTETDLRQPRREQTGTFRTGATRTCAE
uniref:Uncharacterized protein n=1 Tax=Arundo donax TaxID=35708 RepID=A0A0A9EKQ7_ARUDO